MSEQDETSVSPAPVLDDLGRAFEDLYHAVARRNAAETAKEAADQEAADAQAAHQQAWEAVNQLQAGKVPVVPEG